MYNYGLVDCKAEAVFIRDKKRNIKNFLDFQPTGLRKILLYTELQEARLQVTVVLSSLNTTVNK